MEARTPPSRHQVHILRGLRLEASRADGLIGDEGFRVQGSNDGPQELKISFCLCARVLGCNPQPIQHAGA